MAAPDMTVVGNPITAGVSHSCALKTDDTVRCSVRNDSGQFGDATIVNKSSPTAVVGGAIFWQ